MTGGTITNSLGNYLWNGVTFMEAVDSTGEHSHVKVTLGFGDADYKFGATATTTGGELITSLPMSTATQTANIPAGSIVDVQISASRYHGFVSSTLPNLPVTSLITKMGLGVNSAVTGGVGMFAGMKGTASNNIDFSNVVHGLKVYRFTSYNRTATARYSAGLYPYYITNVRGQAFCQAVTDNGTGACYISSNTGLRNINNETAFKHFWMSKLNSRFSNGLTFCNPYWNSSNHSLDPDYRSMMWHFSGAFSSTNAVDQGSVTGYGFLGMGDAKSAFWKAASANSANYFANSGRANGPVKTANNHISSTGSTTYDPSGNWTPYTLYAWRQFSHTATTAVWNYSGNWSASGVVP